MWRSEHPSGRTLASVFAALVACVALGACQRDAPSSDAERFCGEARDNADLITHPSITSEAELDATLDFYRLMGQLAPLAIAEEWAALVHNLEVAAAVVPGDPASEQLVAITAYATEPSAYRVKVWVQQNCAVDLPITTIAPQAPVEVTPPTTPPSSTTAAP